MKLRPDFRLLVDLLYNAAESMGNWISVSYDLSTFPVLFCHLNCNWFLFGSWNSKAGNIYSHITVEFIFMEQKSLCKCVSLCTLK